MTLNRYKLADIVGQQKLAYFSPPIFRVTQVIFIGRFSSEHDCNMAHLSEHKAVVMLLSLWLNISLQ